MDQKNSVTILISLSLFIFSLIRSSIVLWALAIMHPSTSAFPVLACRQFRQIMSIRSSVIVNRNSFSSCSIDLLAYVWSFFSRFCVYLNNSPELSLKSTFQSLYILWSVVASHHVLQIELFQNVTCCIVIIQFLVKFDLERLVQFTFF